MPSFQEIAAFAKEIGLPWCFACVILYIHYKVLWEMSKVQEGICKTLEHIAQHISDEEHSHDH